MLLEQDGVGFQLPGVVQVVRGIVELQGVDEDAGHGNVRAFACGPQQLSVAGVQGTHRGHEADGGRRGFGVLDGGGERILELGDGPENLGHGIPV